MTQPVTKGINPALFDSLTERQRRALVKLMARIAERAYRRGAQQGVVISQRSPQELPRSLADWRFNPTLDRSPWLDSRRSEPSVRRLFMECGEIQQLGFLSPDQT